MSSERDWLAVGPDGRLRCPRRDDEVDLERCLECNWLVDLDRTAAVPAVRCAAVSPIPDGGAARSADPHVD